MDDSEQVDFILQHTPEPERDELAEDFCSGNMTVDEFIFGEAVRLPARPEDVCCWS